MNRADQNNATANITIQTISGSSKTLQSDHGHALSSTSNEGASSSQQPIQIQRQRIGAEGAFQIWTTLMFIIVTCGLFISWIPPAATGIKSILSWKNPQEKLMHMTEKEKWTNALFQMFFSINHTANAIVYWTVNKHFRQGTLNLLRKMERLLEVDEVSSIYCTDIKQFLLNFYLVHVVIIYTCIYKLYKMIDIDN